MTVDEALKWWGQHNPWDSYDEEFLLTCGEAGDALAAEVRRLRDFEQNYGVVEESHRNVSQMYIAEAREAKRLRDAKRVMSENEGRLHARVAKLETQVAGQRPVGPSARPDTLEKCWQTIEYLDVEIAGAMHSEMTFALLKPKLRHLLTILTNEQLDASLPVLAELEQAVAAVRASLG